MSDVKKVVGNVMNGGLKSVANKITTKGKSNATTNSIVNKLTSDKKLKLNV